MHIKVHFFQFVGMYQRNTSYESFDGTPEEVLVQLRQFCEKEGYQYVQPEIRDFFGDIRLREESIPLEQVTAELLGNYDDFGLSKKP